MKRFEFIETKATGDVALVVQGYSLEDLFQNAAFGLFETMVETKGLRQKISREISLTDESIELLLYQWLSELVFLKDAERLFFNDFKPNIKKETSYHLSARVSGEEIDAKLHLLRNDVKAVTLHRFKVEEEQGTWKAQFVLDI